MEDHLDPIYLNFISQAVTENIPTTFRKYDTVIVMQSTYINIE